MSGKVLVLIRLRRDIMSLGTFESASDARDIADQARKQGRAAEGWVIPISEHFSESDIAWANVDTVPRIASTDEPQSNPPLNPQADDEGNPTGEQESLAEPKSVDVTSIRREMAIAAADSATEPTNRNSDGGGHTQEQVDRAKREASDLQAGTQARTPAPSSNDGSTKKTGGDKK